MSTATGESQRTTLQGVQVVRGVAATMVVLFHVAGKLIQDYQADLPGFSAAAKFGFAGVDLFFVLSGFIIVWITWPEIGKASRAPRFLLRRFYRVVPIFWIVWLVSGAMYFALGSQFFRCKSNISIFQQTIDAMFLLNPNGHCIVPQAWTLSWELMFYLIFAAFLCLPRALLPFLLAAWAGAIAAAIMFGFDAVMPLQAFCLHFILGCFVGMLTRLKPIPLPWITVLFSLVLWGGAIWYQYTAAVPADGSPLMRFLVFGIPSAVLLYGVASHDVRSNPRYPAPVQLLGDSSYVLYLVHATILYYLHFAFPRLDPVWGVWIWAIGGVLVSILIACLVHLFVERPMLKAMNNPKNSVIAIAAVVAVAGALIALAWYLQSTFAQSTPAASAPAPVAVAEPEKKVDTPPLPPLESMTFIDGVQGWAPIQVKNTIYEVPGWSIDRERNETVDRILLYIDGVLVEEQIPTYPRPDVPVGKTVGGRQPGFLFLLDAAKVDVAKCVRFVAVLADGRFGRLGIQVRGVGDESEICWNPSERPA